MGSGFEGASVQHRAVLEAVGSKMVLVVAGSRIALGMGQEHWLVEELGSL